jgi:signal transduction histidine kinase
MPAEESNVYTALFMAALVLALILSFFVVSLIRHHKKNIQLHLEKIQAEIKTTEAERSRIAEDLHDDIGPLLSAVKLQISCVNTSNKEDHLLITGALSHIDDSIIKIREIAANLMPTALSRKGLEAAINEFSEAINRTDRLHITTSFFTDTFYLTKEKEIHLYRIIQEIINNTIKHSYATEAIINISSKKNRLILEIRDNGGGFDYPDIIKNNSGAGLRNILSRVEIMNGTIYIDTAQKKGVQFTVEIPQN